MIAFGFVSAIGRIREGDFCHVQRASWHDARIILHQTRREIDAN